MPKNAENEARMCKNEPFYDLESRFSSLRVRVFDEIDSTNAEAKRMVADGFAGERALLVAYAQSAGRGRMGRSFYSPADTGAYFSVLCRVRTELCEAVTVTSAAAVAVMRAVRRLTGLQAEIKWVNDLYLHEKKICGILTESTGVGDERFQIVGIGINLHTDQFPPELQSIAGSIGCAELARDALICAVYEELEPYLNDPFDRSWLNDYRVYSCVLGRPVQWLCDGVQACGFAEAIDDSGALLVRDETGKTVRLFSGEISVRTSFRKV